ncbi:ExbD/TolR family protein [Halioxenophilus aromaticivorans]|uniref:RNA polymerase subunit sigma-70 n=1 Tax=Halioxenophilus aromaticivorans TaxID=1306992 RepID=A0AAV3U5K8_9ALTE
MKQSLRAKRMAKHHKRLGSGSKLNLVSLMDIFTILVFFLLINSDDVEVLQNNEAIDLPKSVAEQKPDNTLTIMVSASDILVNGQQVARIADVLQAEETDIKGLAVELNYRAQRAGELTELQQQKGRAVTIMGDATIPYQLLKKIMATCASTDYRDMSFAVSQIAAKTDDTGVTTEPVDLLPQNIDGEG